MNLIQISKICNGKLNKNNNIQIKGFSTDTRTIRKGEIYVALIGENLDGHRFIKSAFEKGAAACIVSDKKVVNDKNSFILVDDTLKALQDLAKNVRKENNVPVVAITGSVGKTSTRDLIGSVVSSHFNTMKTKGNLNNEIGLPLTLLKYKKEEAMVLEMGMNHMREIALLADIARPNIGVITNVGTAHIGNLGSRENILKAKLEIAEQFTEKDTLIINIDNNLLHNFYKDNNVKYKIKTFAINRDADFKAENVVLNERNSSFDCNGHHFVINVPGEHFVLNALSAIAVGDTMGIPYDKIQNAISNFALTENRMDFIKLDKIEIIDGSYNANLDSMISSLKVLGKQKKRKVAILADMLELGKYSKELHHKVGEAVVENNVDLLICIGHEAKEIYEGAAECKNKIWSLNNKLAIDDLLREIHEGNIVLVKGSMLMNLKEIVAYLKNNF